MLWDPFLYCINDSIQGNSETGNKVFTLPSEVSINTILTHRDGVNVYHYLTYLLEKMPDDRMSDDELELLAPWNETVKAEIERRANESNQSYVNCQGAPATEK